MFSFTRTLATCLGASLLLVAQPPQARLVPTTEDFHGTAVREDYRWLEDPDSPETRQWVQAQVQYAQNYFQAIPARAALRSRLEQLHQYDRVTDYSERGNLAFYRKQTGLQNQPVLYVSARGGSPRVLLDPNSLSKEGTAAVSSFDISRDGKYAAYAIAKAGSDWVVWHVRDVGTGKDLPEQLDWAKFSGAEWDAASLGFYYGRYPAPAAGNGLQALNEHYKIYYHRLNTGQAEDKLIYERPDQPLWSLGVTVSDDGRYLVFNSSKGTYQNQISYVDTTKPGAGQVSLIDTFFASFRFLGNSGAKMIFSTNYEAPRYRIIEIDPARPDRANWRTIVGETADTLRQAKLVKGTLVLNYMHDVSGKVRTMPLAQPAQARDLPLPANSSISIGEGSSRIFSVASFTAPSTIYACDATCRPLFAVKLQFDPALFESRQVFYASKDRTKIPMYLVHKKGLALTGANPTLLYAYGGFNIATTPSYSPFVTAWMERGGVYAVANIRGGNEYGEQWHQGGMKGNKQNVFDDFIAAAEWLVANKYTSTPRLAIRGGSNGGLLVGAVLNQRPELFGAAIPQVGVMDMLRFDRFTIGHSWAGEFGSPKNPEDFQVIYKYSPLHNIRQGGVYPPTLITTADHDDRVVPGHSFKYAAVLQRAQGGAAPILIRIETSAGHGAGTPTAKRIDSEADVLAFLARTIAGS